MNPDDNMISNDKGKILLAHGGGGVMMQELIQDVILRHLKNPILDSLEDAALIAAQRERLAFTTDAFVVKPIFFRGGDIGRLAVCGTVNDLACAGAMPIGLSLSMVLEEGLPIETLDRVCASVAEAAKEAKVDVVAGDTKVVERGAADGLYLTTSGIGAVPDNAVLSPMNVRPGDAVLVTGPLGDHGIAIISERNGLEFETPVLSDVAPLSGLVGELLAAHVADLHCMRDPTRGGAAAVLNEIATGGQVSIEIDEERVPVRPEVVGACDMLGFDPLYVPCEGRLVIFCAEEVAESIVQRIQTHPYGQGAARIGTVGRGQTGRVTLRTNLGGTRIVAMPYGEQLPRIC